MLYLIGISKQIYTFVLVLSLLKYDNQYSEDIYGFISDQPLEIEEFTNNEISETEFEEIWRKNNPIELSDDFKSALRHFVYYYSNGTLQYVIGDDKLLQNINYREELKDEASLVEQAFAIFTNNIKMDENGEVLNLTHSMKRASQWIRFVCRDENDNYVVEPEFEDWEVYLH